MGSHPESECHPRSHWLGKKSWDLNQTALLQGHVLPSRTPTGRWKRLNYVYVPLFTWLSTKEHHLLCTVTAVLPEWNCVCAITSSRTVHPTPLRCKGHTMLHKQLCPRKLAGASPNSSFHWLAKDVLRANNVMLTCHAVSALCLV